MKASAIRELPWEELLRKRDEIARELFDARVAAATGQSGHTHKVRTLRRTVARIRTIARERELGIRETDAAEAETEQK